MRSLHRRQPRRVSLPSGRQLPARARRLPRRRLGLVCQAAAALCLERRCLGRSCRCAARCERGGERCGGAGAGHWWTCRCRRCGRGGSRRAVGCGRHCGRCASPRRRAICQVAIGRERAASPAADVGSATAAIRPNPPGVKANPAGFKPEPRCCVSRPRWWRRRRLPVRQPDAPRAVGHARSPISGWKLVGTSLNLTKQEARASPQPVIFRFGHFAVRSRGRARVASQPRLAASAGSRWRWSPGQRGLSWVTNVCPADADQTTRRAQPCPRRTCVDGIPEVAEIWGMCPRLATADDVAQNADARRHDLRQRAVVQVGLAEHLHLAVDVDVVAVGPRRGRVGQRRAAGRRGSGSTGPG